jgi:hypothetical protein
VLLGLADQGIDVTTADLLVVTLVGATVATPRTRAATEHRRTPDIVAHCLPVVPSSVISAFRLVCWH